MHENNPYYSYITNGGNPTLDKIFLLSYADVMNTNYGFDSGIEDSLTRCSTLTDYAKQRANNSSCASNGKPYGSNATDAIYWLRNPGKANNCACTVKPYGCSEGQMNKGDLLYWGVFDDRVGVRPAFYIDSSYAENMDKEYCEYSLKIIDFVTKKPIKNCEVRLDGNTYVSDEKGCLILYIDNVNEYYGKPIEFLSSVYEEHTCFITDLDLYSQNIIRMKSIAYLKFFGASLTLYNDLSISYKVDKSLFEENRYQNPYVKFMLNGVETVVKEYRVVEDKYIFDFDDIAPNRMNDTIYATLYAEFNNIEYASETKEYSIGEYCYSMLGQYSTKEYEELRTLVVDLLNYGSEAQNYTSYNVTNLANQSLTEEQNAWATTEALPLETVFDKQYKTVESPSVLWKGAGLKLEDSITMRFKIETDSLENLVAKVVSESNQEWSIASSAFEVCDGGYYIYFDGLNAGQMREVVYVTMYKGTEVVSDTLCYSIESYAYAMQDLEDEKLKSLLDRMMKYGDSAYEYIH